MRIERVRRAARSSMVSGVRVEGRLISRSLPPSPVQVSCTPIDLSTSQMRSTSSMCATPRRTVRPLLRRLAHSNAMAAFLEVRTSISPDSVVGPWISKFTLPCVWVWINGISSASARRSIMLSERFCCPVSIRCTALWTDPSSSASRCCDHPRAVRASRIMRPMDSLVALMTARLSHE